MTSPLPGARAAFTDASGRPTPQFYRFLEQLVVAQGGNASSSDLASLSSQLAALQGEVDAIPTNGGYPRLRVNAPLRLQGLLQNGFALLEWAGTTDDVPEGDDNLYFTNARADARIEAHDTLPCFLSDGTQSNLSLTSDLKVPCFLSDGTESDLATAA